MSIQRGFEEFHRKNPKVYGLLVRFARSLKARGFAKAGIGLIFERTRWEIAMTTTGDDYKLNNNYRSRYARLIMEQEPDLADFFEVRELKNVEDLVS